MIQNVFAFAKAYVSLQSLCYCIKNHEFQTGLGAAYAFDTS